MKKLAIKQGGMFGCGLACIHSIASYLHIDSKSVKGLSPNHWMGFSFVEMIMLLDQIGIRSKGYKFTDEACITSDIYPFIAHLKIGFLQHYVVVYRKINESYLIMEPSIGKMFFIKQNFFHLFWTRKSIVIES